jgi:hypothetical protein
MTLKYPKALVVAVVVGLAACSSSATAPTASGPPNVAGSYSGTITVTTTRSAALACPAQVTVAQNGANVTLAPLVFTGACASIGSFPLGDATISNTDSLGSATQSLFFESCSGFYDVTLSGGFSGNTLQFSLLYTAKSGGCVTQLGDISYSGNLSK